MVSIKLIRRIGAVALILPAGDHLISPILTMIFAPSIMSMMFGATGAIPTAVFFIILGLFQFGWVAVLLKSKSPTLLTIGILVNLALIAIYFISVAGVTFPFGVPPQPFIPFAVVIKALEAVFVVASIYAMKNAKKPT